MNVGNLQLRRQIIAVAAIDKLIFKEYGNEIDMNDEYGNIRHGLIRK